MSQWIDVFFTSLFITNFNNIVGKLNSDHIKIDLENSQILNRLKKKKTFGGYITIGLLLIMFIFSGDVTNSNVDTVMAKDLQYNKEVGILYPIKKDNKWGYINKNGSIVIPPRYEMSQPSFFHEGLAIVIIDYVTRRTLNNYVVPMPRYGFINLSGQVVIDKIIKDGKVIPDAMVFPPEINPYDMEFHDGLCPIMLWEGYDQKWGYIDNKGKVIIQPNLSLANCFSEGLAYVEISDSVGTRAVIDTSGNIIFKISNHDGDYRYCLFSEGLAAIIDGNPCGEGNSFFINKKGEIVIKKPELLHDLGRFCEGLASFSKGCGDREKWGYIDKTGHVVIKPTYSDALYFSNGLAPVLINNKWGYINRTGKVVIEPQYDTAYPFIGELALVSIKYSNNVNQIDKIYFGYIDKTGKYIWKPSY
jgi:hypothetical protein